MCNVQMRMSSEIESTILTFLNIIYKFFSIRTFLFDPLNSIENTSRWRIILNMLGVPIEPRLGEVNDRKSKENYLLENDVKTKTL